VDDEERADDLGAVAVSRYARKVDGTQKPLVQAIRALGWYVKDMSRLGQGWPDLYAVKGGRSVWIECKAERAMRRTKNGSRENATRDRQAETHAELRRYGAEVAVVATLEDLAQLERPVGARAEGLE
jgi:hypothetical protein